MIKAYSISIKAIKYDKTNQKEIMDLIHKVTKQSATVEPNSDGSPINLNLDSPLTIGSWLVLINGKEFKVLDDETYKTYYRR